MQVASGGNVSMLRTGGVASLRSPPLIMSPAMGKLDEIQTTVEDFN